METKTITLRLPIEVAQFIESRTEGGFTDSVKELVTKVKALEGLAEKEVNDIFEKNEWNFFFDSMNGLIVEDWMRYSSDVLIAGNEDAELYEGTAKKWSINLEALNKKCKTLTSAQVDALYRRVEKFWSKPYEERDSIIRD